MPPKSKATGRSAKKGKALKKSARVAAAYDSDLTSGEDEPSVCDALRGLTTMMATMSSRLDDMEGEGRKRRRVAFRNLLTASRSSEDEAAPETASPGRGGRFCRCRWDFCVDLDPCSTPATSCTAYRPGADLFPPARSTSH